MMKTGLPLRLALGGLAVAVVLAPGMALSRAEAAPAAAPPPAAAPAEPAAVTLSVRDLPLRAVLPTLFEGRGLQHAVEPAVPNSPITLDIRDLPFSTALRTLLRLAPRVVYRKEGDIYNVAIRLW